MSVLIQHLEFRFDVDASDEEAAFAKLYQKYATAQARQQRERDEAEEASELDRALGDQV
jgi:hypothetical protein